MFRSAYIRKYLKKYLGHYLLGVLGIALVNVALVYLPRLIGDTTDGLANGIYDMGDLWRTGLLALLIGLSVFAGRMLWRFFFLGTSRKIEYHIRGDLFAHLETLSLRFYNENKSGDLMAYAVNDLNAVRNTLAMGFISALDASTLLVMVLFQMMTSVDPLLTLLAVIPMPLIAFVSIKMRRLIRLKFREKQESFANLTDQVQESISGIRVIKSFVQEKKEAEAFRQKAEDNYRKNMTLTKIMAVLEPAIGVITGVSTLITLVYGGYLAMTNEITLGDFIAFIQYLLMLAGPLSGMGRCINIFSQGNASMARIESLLHTKPDVYDMPTADPKAEVKGEVSFNHLNFRYPNSPEEALKDINVHIERGQTVGIIGRTGSGKTSFVSLLLRLYNTKPGELVIDGTDILDYPLHKLRSSIGYVPQDNFLFSDTIANNIRFGCRDASMEQVETAAKMADVHSNIIDFPDGYDTMVGERGVTLSGGQKQRVSIARAIVKNPPILILDDAVSAVDTETEEHILRELKKAREGKTTIIIAHRISTIQHADQILVIDEGKIVQHGQHEQLSQEEGIYKTIYEKQLLEEEIDQQPEQGGAHHA
ncbi:MAG: ABC transporter ATP-binding protein [Firmicutes bacterium]|nr:ABC transporter ATP-binding protein [Bacillota bacterium]